MTDVTGILSVVHRRIQNPVRKLAQEVQKNVAKTANINPDLETVDGDVEHPVKEDKPSATTSAHAVSGTHVNEELPRPTAQRTKSARRMHIPTADNGETTDVQKAPKFSPPAKRGTQGEDEEDVDKDFDVHGFDHPSTYEQQPWVWVPRDPYGISRLVVEELRAAGVEASDEGAVMDEKGTVEVTRNPPDQDWEGGNDA